jgi:hypothetical protein
MSLYGLTVEEFNELLKLQDKKCAICYKKVPLDVDHCHDKNRVRGLLCQKCNKGIGLLNDDIQILKNAISYLSL